MPEKNWILFVKSRYFILNIIGGLFACIFLLFIFLKSLDFITHHGEEIKVPNTLGQTMDAGKKSLEDMGFTVKIDSVFKPGKPGGEIIDQSPSPGELVKDHRTLYLTVVKFTAPMVQLPPFKDIPFKEYESNLKSLGLDDDSIEYEPDIAKDLVLGIHFQGKNLSPGALLSKGSKLTLILGDGLGGNMVNLPNVLGFGLDEARFAIRGAQLLVGHVSYIGVITDSSKVKIIQQTPNPGLDSTTKVSQGTLVNLVLQQVQ